MLTHTQVWAIIYGVLRCQGDYTLLGKKWIKHFMKYHPVVKTKLSCQIDWEYVNAATSTNIKHLFELYETVRWIPSKRQYNADKGGIMAG
jgi:hypothetical protein